MVVAVGLIDGPSSGQVITTNHEVGHFTVAQIVGPLQSPPMVRTHVYTLFTKVIDERPYRFGMVDAELRYSIPAYEWRWWVDILELTSMTCQPSTSG